MLRVDCIHVLRTAGVAGQAARIYFFGGCFFKKEELGDVGRIGSMAGRCTVTVLAAVFGDPAFPVCLLPMRTFLPTIVDIGVACLAGFRTRVLGRLSLGGIRRTLFLHGRYRFVAGRGFFLWLCQSESR